MLKRSKRFTAVATAAIWLSMIVTTRVSDYLFLHAIFSVHPEVQSTVKEVIGPDIPKMLQGLSGITFSDWAFALFLKYGFSLLVSYALAHLLRALFARISLGDEPNSPFERTALPPLN